jgi:hypothetical protein
MKRTTMFLLGGGALASIAIAASSAKKSAPKKYLLADVPKPSVLPLPPPMQGTEFRSGVQPHPEYPNSNDAGRFWSFWGASSKRHYVSDHDAHLLDLAPTANGSIDVRLYANLAGEPSRCFARTYTLEIENGRIAKWRIGGSGKGDAVCPQGSIPLLQGLPFQPGVPNASKVPTIGWEGRGPGVWLLWKVTGTHEPIDNNVGFSPEDSPGFGFYVDILWRFYPA